MSHTINHFSTRNPMWVFEENYRLLMKLLTVDLEAGDDLILAGRDGQQLSLNVAECTPYTSTLVIARSFPGLDTLLPELSMSLRIYYDARVVEVLCYQGEHRIPPRYSVSEHDAFSRDEKRQVNQLLHELLRHCIQNDYQPLSVELSDS